MFHCICISSCFVFLDPEDWYHSGKGKVIDWLCIGASRAVVKGLSQAAKIHTTSNFHQLPNFRQVTEPVPLVLISASGHNSYTCITDL